ncbi:MAG TPA: potassium-transporting ATPase subunit C [Acetobacteraceae bacterium]|nr:potassium-transporting ATPase subunit C [Acetobacteraceae bacterium]
MTQRSWRPKIRTHQFLSIWSPRQPRGLDPDIAPAGALFQAPRLAKARGLPVDQVRQLVEQHISGRLLGVIGEPHVNALQLSLALDGLKG